MHRIRFICRIAVAALALSTFSLGAMGAGVRFDARSARSGAWSDPHTWENQRAPRAGDSVQVRTGHQVVYDVQSEAALRVVHVAGTLSFSREKDTRLDVGLLKVQAGEACSEDGFVCAVHDDEAAMERKQPAEPAPSVDAAAAVPPAQRPALEVGTPDQPIPAGVTAAIRLVYFDGMDPDNLPAIVDCGGRMDFHGAPMGRTWLKLEHPMKAGEKRVTLQAPAVGWKRGDRIILTASKPLEYSEEKGPKGKKKSATGGAEQRLIASVDGAVIDLTEPVDDEHVASDAGRCEAANLSRNVVIESADPQGDDGAHRGHTLYHRHSTGSISYAEFRHLGKQGKLGRYPIHFHLVRDGMRNSGGVVGASIWDSANRFIAIHGTDYLLVRDCVGYGAIGHGFFLEDATEQYNLLDRNLAVGAKEGKPLPGQVLGFDRNEGAGFWWANGRNTLVHNVACENNKYGFRFEIGKVRGKPPLLLVRQPDGSTARQDVRAIPFLRFEGNESHSEGLYSFFFGDDPAGSVGGDEHHPFIARDLFAWETHYALRPTLTHFLMERLNVDGAAYGVYHPDYNAHVYRDIRIARTGSEPINRGHDDESIQYGSFTYDRLTLDNCPGMPLIQLSCTAPVEGLSGHFRGLKVNPVRYPKTRVVDLGVGPVLAEKDLKKGVAYYFHESAGDGEAGRTLRVVSIKFPGMMAGGDYKEVPGFTGKGVRAAEVNGAAFPKLLDPIDDLPPATLITSVQRGADKTIVRGVTHDNGEVASIDVNGRPARITSSAAGVADWEVTIDAPAPTITAAATDAAGNVEQTPAVLQTAR